MRRDPGICGKSTRRARARGPGADSASITFAKDKETTVDPEITAEPLDAEGTLIIFDEEVQAE